MYIQRGESALMEAARRGKTGVVKELMKRGADLNLQNKVCQYECTKVQNPRHHAYARFTQKMSDCTYGLQRRECWISPTEWFQTKTHKYFDLCCLLST